MGHAILSGLVWVLVPVLAMGMDGPKPGGEVRRPELVAREAGQAWPLKLAKADIVVGIRGDMAQTTMTLTFQNDNGRVMEGELVFPVPAGATITRFGLDVNGEIVDGVPVEKQRARVIFENEARKRVDPGIVEHVSGNTFRTRVYPIAANGSRTVRIEYISELVQEKGEALYTLPMSWGDMVVGASSIKVAVWDVVGEPRLVGLAAEGLTVEQQEDRVLLSSAVANARFKDDLLIAVPELGSQHAMVEKHRPEGVGRPDYYFLIRDLPVVLEKKPVAPVPQRIGIMWDASYSRVGADRKAELAIVRKVLAKAPGAMVDVVVFRNDVESPLRFKAEDVEDLLKTLEGAVCDGATSLGQLSLCRNFAQLFPGRAMAREEHDYAYWLVFTDGRSTTGEVLPKAAQSPAYVISGDVLANHRVLEYMAQTSGGRYFNLKRTGEAEVLGGIGERKLMLLGVEYDAEEIEAVFPAGRQVADGPVAVCGRICAPVAKVTLKYGYGTEPIHRVQYTLRQEGASGMGMASTFWAQQKIEDLSLRPAKNHEAILAVGREFCTVTPDTSLMVLETLEQHVQYGVTPAKTRGDLHARYAAYTQGIKGDAQSAAQTHTEEVVKKWLQRVDWWEEVFRYPRGFVYVEPRPVAPGGPVVVRRERPKDRLPWGVIPGRKRQQQLEAERRQEDRNSGRGSRDNGAIGGGYGGGGYGGGGGMGGMGGMSRGGGNAPAAGDAVRQPAPVAKVAVPVRDEPVDSPVIRVRPWDPQTPYMAALNNAKPEKAYGVYLDRRGQYAGSPAFFLDCADYFIKNNRRDLASRILGSLLELELEHAPLLRQVGYRAWQMGELDLAVEMLEKVLAISPQEPQSYRDLALVLADRAGRAGQPAAGIGGDLTRSANLLCQVVNRQWSERFPEIELVALMDLNAVLAKIRGIPTMADYKPSVDARLVKLLDMDTRITLTWDTENTDIDLVVTEPSGERCFADHQQTTIGGFTSADFHFGFGPEEYTLRHAMEGKYKVQANFFGTTELPPARPTTVLMTVITNFGRPNEQRKVTAARLVGKNATVDLGTIVLGEGKTK